MSMLDDIRTHLDKVPFEPFALRTADGREYPVPTLDHIYFVPGGKRIVVADDRGVIVSLTTMYITGFVQGLPPRAKRKRS